MARRVLSGLQGLNAHEPPLRELPLDDMLPAQALIRQLPGMQQQDEGADFGLAPKAAFIVERSGVKATARFQAA